MESQLSGSLVEGWPVEESDLVVREGRGWSKGRDRGRRRCNEQWRSPGEHLGDEQQTHRATGRNGNSCEIQTNISCISRRRTRQTFFGHNSSHNLLREGQKRRKIPTLTFLLAILIIIEYFTLELSKRSLTQAFNVDTQSAVVHSGPQGSYFGFSVAQHRDRGVNWLLVGAPKAQTDQPKTKESGAVYRCTPAASKACQQIPFDPNGSSVINLRGEQTQSDDKSYQGFGASLASASDNGSIVACAPRYVYFSTNLKRRDPVGTCWVSRGSFNGFLEYSPCRLNGSYPAVIANLQARPNNVISPPNVKENKLTVVSRRSKHQSHTHTYRPVGPPPLRLVPGGILQCNHASKYRVRPKLLCGAAMWNCVAAHLPFSEKRRCVDFCSTRHPLRPLTSAAKHLLRIPPNSIGKLSPLPSAFCSLQYHSLSSF